MLLNRIKLSNFKNFDEAEVSLGKMNVLVGANASGKSNFLQAIRFFRDVMVQGVENAISLQGGIEYIKNVNATGKNIKLEFEIVDFQGPFYHKIGISDQEGSVGLGKVIYAITLSSEDKESIDENVSFVYYIYGKKTGDKHIGEENISINLREKISSFKTFEEELLKTVKDERVSKILSEGKTLLRPILEFTSLRILGEEMTGRPFLGLLGLNISFYDFDLKYPKRGISLAGQAHLEEDGRNLAIVLKKILKEQENRRKLINLLGDILPFVRDIEVENYYNNTLLFKLREAFQERSIPSSFLSDGTIAATLIIVALYFEHSSFVGFEEPDNGIHPGVIPKLMNLFYQAAEKKQILITTHNPEVVKHTKAEDLLFVSRKSDGSSVIKRPNDSQEVHAFLDNELGMDELFTQDLLDF